MGCAELPRMNSDRPAGSTDLGESGSIASASQQASLITACNDSKAWAGLRVAPAASPAAQSRRSTIERSGTRGNGSGPSRRQQSWKFQEKSAFWSALDPTGSGSGLGSPFATESNGGTRSRTRCFGFRQLVRLVRVNAQLVAKVARTSPGILVASLLALACLLAVGIWGTLYFAHATERQEKQQAKNIANDLANELHSILQVLYTPTTALATFIKLDPNWPRLQANFVYIAREILAGLPQTFVPVSVLALEIAPLAVLEATYLPITDTMGSGAEGLNLLKDATRRGSSLQTIQDARLTLAGPYNPIEGTATAVYGAYMVARLPIFIRGVLGNETFGLPAGSSSYLCDICYNNQTQTLFWGFTIALIAFKPVIDLVSSLDERGYSYRLQDSVGNVLASNAKVPVVLPNTLWVLQLAHKQGWEPHWKKPMLAGVILAACLIAGLTFGVLVSKRSYMWLLETMLPPKAISALQRGEGFCESFSCVTILFCDLVSYTSMAAALTPIEVVELLNEVYTIFDGLSDEHACYKVETIGDAWMCVAGCPEREEAAAAACRLARLAKDMIVATRAFVSSRGHRIRIRCGMHSGPIVAAIIGSRMPRYALFGDTVNTAARFESYSEPMAVHVSDATARLLAEADPRAQSFIVQERGIINIKGKGDMMCHWLNVPLSGLASPTDDGADSTSGLAESGGARSVSGGRPESPTPRPTHLSQLMPILGLGAMEGGAAGGHACGSRGGVGAGGAHAARLGSASSLPLSVGSSNLSSASMLRREVSLRESGLSQQQQLLRYQQLPEGYGPATPPPGPRPMSWSGVGSRPSPLSGYHQHSIAALMAAVQLGRSAHLAGDYALPALAGQFDTQGSGVNDGSQCSLGGTAHGMPPLSPVALSSPPACAPLHQVQFGTLAGSSGPAYGSLLPEQGASTGVSLATLTHPCAQAGRSSSAAAAASDSGGGGRASPNDRPSPEMAAPACQRSNIQLSHLEPVPSALPPALHSTGTSPFLASPFYGTGALPCVPLASAQAVEGAASRPPLPLQAALLSGTHSARALPLPLALPGTRAVAEAASGLAPTAEASTRQTTAALDVAGSGLARHVHTASELRAFAASVLGCPDVVL